LVLGAEGPQVEEKSCANGAEDAAVLVEVGAAGAGAGAVAAVAVNATGAARGAAGRLTTGSGWLPSQKVKEVRPPGGARTRELFCPLWPEKV